MGWKDHLIYPTRAQSQVGYKNNFDKNVKVPRAWRIAAIESLGGGDKWTYVHRSHPRGIGRPITQEQFNELHRHGEVYKTFKAYRPMSYVPRSKIPAKQIDAKKHEYYKWLDEKYQYAQTLKQKHYWANLGTMFLNSTPINKKKPEKSHPPERRDKYERRYYDRLRSYSERPVKLDEPRLSLKRERDATIRKDGGDRKYQKLYDDFHDAMFEDMTLADRRDMIHNQW